jgi:hypothetical protein
MIVTFDGIFTPQPNLSDKPLILSEIGWVKPNRFLALKVISVSQILGSRTPLLREMPGRFLEVF